MAERFEVWLVALEPTQGAEIGKTRPAVVISPDDANKHLRTVIVSPLTSRRRNWPTRVPVVFARTRGDVALDQMRAVDKGRLMKRLGALKPAEREGVLDVLAQIFAP